MIAATQLYILAADLETVEKIGLYVLPIFGSVLLAYAVYNLIHDLRKPEVRRVSDRLKEKFGADAESDKDRAVKESILRRQQDQPSAIGVAMLQISFMPKLQRLLDQANLPWRATTALLNVVGASAVAYIAGFSFQLPQWQ